MKKGVIEFDVYIGKDLRKGLGGANITVCNQSKKFYIPSGDNNKSKNIDKFERLHDVGTFFADWCDNMSHIDLPKDCIKATIMLNNKSKKKVFYGTEIQGMIDKINNSADWTLLKEFPQ